MINADKVRQWKSDITASVDLYNTWFFKAAPEAYRSTRARTILQVENAMARTDYMRSLSPDIIRHDPEVVSSLRMMTSPPLAQDRLSGLGELTSNSFVKTLEKGKIPSRMKSDKLTMELEKICATVTRLVDLDLLPWLDGVQEPNKLDVYVAATVIADRLCGAVSDPIVRNAQERRQLDLIDEYLDNLGYSKKAYPKNLPLEQMPRGTYSFRQEVLVGAAGNPVKIPVDVVIQPHNGHPSGYPILIECKSAGDFTNTNKRRKEEAQKYRQLKERFNEEIPFILFLNGYFGPPYLGYSASEGIDWIWEHRITDMEELGL